MSFFRDLIPETGETCLTRLSGKGAFIHKWVDLHSTEDIKDVALPWAKQGHDVYFAMASFNEDADGKLRRKQDNVDRLKCLWLDIDAGKAKYAKHGKKVYKTFKHAAQDLQDWLKWSEIPHPTHIVRSGTGLHVYWGLKKSVDVETWKRLNAGLVSLAKEGELRIDAGASKNHAGVLRVPGTLHTKTGRIVRSIYRSDELLSVKALEKALPCPEPKPASPLGEMPEHLKQADRKKWDQYGTSMAKILRRSRDYAVDDKRTGCRQMWLIATDQESVEEPLWRAGLSITENCDSPEKWGHLISSSYSGYDPEETDVKRASVAGKPYTCAAFDDLNPDACKGCPHAGKITSPIQLGKYTKTEDEAPEPDEGPAEDEPEDEELEEEEPTKGASSTTYSPESVWEEIDPLDWKPPFPYKRKKGGGIVRKSDEEDVVVCDYDIIFTDRKYAGDHDNEGESLCFDVHLPNDGKRSFELLAATTTDDTKIAQELAKRGVHLNRSRYAAMGNFIRACADNLVKEVTANETAESIGWTPDSKAFVLGHTRYERKERRRAALGSQAEALAETTELRGNKTRFEKWADSIAMYDHKGMEPSKFILAACLAGPLYRLQGENGPVLHIYSHETGLGKTAVARAALSIWGRPKRSGHKLGLESTAKDTENALRTRLTVHNSIPMSIDEVTDLDDQRLRALIYEFTQGTEKQRSTSNGGLSAHGGTWDTCMFTTGNKSLFDRLGGDSNREALFARFMEVDYSKNKSLRAHYDVNEIDDALQSLYKDTYGVAGHVFINWLIQHPSEAERIMQSVTEYLDSKVEFKQGERYWRSAMICTLTACRIGYDLGMWDWEAKELVPYVRKLIRSHRQDSAELEEVQDETIGAYMNQRLDAVVIADSNGQVPDHKLPRQTAAIRIDHQRGQVMIAQADLDKWAKTTQRNLREMHKHLYARGAVKERISLLAGSQSRDGVAAPMMCWVLPLTMVTGPPD